MQVGGRTKAHLEFVPHPDQPNGLGMKVSLAEAEAHEAAAVALDDPRSLIYLDDSLRTGTSDAPAAPSKKALHEAVAGGTAELFELHQPDPIFLVRPQETMIDRLKAPGGERAGVRFRPFGAVPAAPVFIRYGVAVPPDDDDWYVEELLMDEPAGGAQPGQPRPKHKILVVVKKGQRP
jgi:hypothetical protein